MRSEIASRIRWKAFAAVSFAVAIMLAAPPKAYAQQVVAFVNGQPITTLDIEHRAKFLQMSSKKVPPRKEVLDSLIDEILEIAEAKRYGLDVPDAQVDEFLQHRRKPHGNRCAKADPIARGRRRQR